MYVCRYISIHLLLYLDDTATTLARGEIHLGFPLRTIQGTLLGNLLPEECLSLSVLGYFKGRDLFFQGIREEDRPMV